MKLKRPEWSTGGNNREVVGKSNILDWREISMIHKSRWNNCLILGKRLKFATRNRVSSTFKGEQWQLLFSSASGGGKRASWLVGAQS